MSDTYTLITGASGGIGLELAKVFCAQKHHVILVARSAEKLAKIQDALEKKFGVRVQFLVKDLSLPGAPREIFEEIERRNWQVDILINNAGFGLHGAFSETEWSKELEMIQLNMTALTDLTKRFLKPMLAKRSGKILNVASTAAFQPGPLMAVYYATKAYVLSFTEALSEELKGTGVKVSVLCPGATRTDFQSRAEMDASVRLFKGPLVMQASEVAVLAYRDLMKGKTVILPGFFNKMSPLGARLLPRGWLTSLVHSLQRARSH